MHSDADSDGDTDADDDTDTVVGAESESDECNNVDVYEKQMHPNTSMII